MMQPTPRNMRLKGPSVRFSPCVCASRCRDSMDLRAKSREASCELPAAITVSRSQSAVLKSRAAVETTG